MIAAREKEADKRRRSSVLQIKNVHESIHTHTHTTPNYFIFTLFEFVHKTSFSIIPVLFFRLCAFSIQSPRKNDTQTLTL